MRDIKVITSGRHGKIQYIEGLLKKNTCEFYWEFGGGETVAMIWFPAEAEWEALYPWAKGRRREILDYVAEQTRLRKALSARIKWDGDCLLFVEG